MDKCIGLMGQVFGHNFEPRYNTTSKLNPENMPESPVVLGFGESIVDSYKDKVKLYKGDVCTRCGMVINKQE